MTEGKIFIIDEGEYSPSRKRKPTESAGPQEEREVEDERGRGQRAHGQNGRIL